MTLVDKYYEMIKKFYGSAVAQRSQVPLMNHIDEGLTILRAINASDTAQAAFCVHPIIQNDEDFILSITSGSILQIDDPEILVTAMEYRSTANNYLSKDPPENVRLSVLEDVNNMLIADKVQNRKDFIKYHKGTHPRSSQLNFYFLLWMSTLGISEDDYTRLSTLVEN